uniref:Transcriptional repressor, CopY family n=1 Tax=Cyanothece sp. (strain PCC 7425 / ATCC 29141) TaxID=395961 RepID=B8HXQ1_CYAP4
MGHPGHSTESDNQEAGLQHSAAQTDHWEDADPSDGNQSGSNPVRSNPARSNLSEPQPGRSARTNSPIDILSLPAEQRQLMNWILRQRQATLKEIADKFQQTPEALQPLLSDLVEQGFLTLEQDGEQSCYSPRLQRKPQRRLSEQLWQKLDQG